MNNTITFHIDAQVVDIFNLILAHTGENKETLFNNWRKSGINSPNFSPNPSSEKTEVIIDLSEISEREQGALFFFMDEVLKHLI